MTSLQQGLSYTCLDCVDHSHGVDCRNVLQTFAKEPVQVGFDIQQFFRRNRFEFFLKVLGIDL